jgi:hypothetical protein
VIANFSVRPQTAPRYGHRSSGAPVAVIAESLHAELYGLPFDRDTAPNTLADLADAAHAAHVRSEQDTVLAHLVDQLPHLADVLALAATWAERRANVPEHIAEQIADTAAITHQMSTDLAQVHRAFTQPSPAPVPGVSPPAAQPPSSPARPARR